jgi:hypothetical protein
MSLEFSHLIVRVNTVSHHIAEGVVSFLSSVISITFASSLRLRLRVMTSPLAKVDLIKHIGTNHATTLGAAHTSGTFTHMRQ